MRAKPALARGLAVALAACGGSRAAPVEKPAPAAAPAGGPVAGQALSPQATELPASARSAVNAASPVCGGQAGAFPAMGYRDAKGRDWYLVTCARGPEHASSPGSIAHVLVGGSGDRPLAGLVFEGDAVVERVEVYELPGSPVVCLDSSWHDEEQLREGWDTNCLREVDGSLALVYSMGDTSRADGTTSSFEVHAGPPEEIWDVVDCDDCEVCAMERDGPLGADEDCAAVPPGVQRYVTHMVWDGRAFVARGPQVRIGPAPAPSR